MDFSDRLGKTAESKLIPFRSPAPALRGLDAVPDFDQVPHDIGMLRRPVAVHNFEAPRLQQIDGLAHDARNLLTSLSLIAGLLDESDVLADEHKHYAGELQSLTSSLSGLVEQMVIVPRAPGPAVAGDPVCVREPLRPRLPASQQALAAGKRTEGQEDAGVMVKSGERLLAALAGPNVALHISYERGLGALALAGEDLTRVLINLVKNASEAMPGGGRIAITVRKALGRPAALITVQDTGAGIPAHALGQIFQAGFSSKQAARRWPATEHRGLGLTIVRELVEAAGGSVRVSSTLKKGTTFELKVPCTKG